MVKGRMWGLVICFMLLAENHVFAEIEEYKEDEHTLFLAHFETSLKADYSKGDSKPIEINKLPYRKDGMVRLIDQGKLGRGILTGNEKERLVLAYWTKGNFNKDKGTIEMWVRPHWDGNDGKIHIFFQTIGTRWNKNAVTFLKTKKSTLEFRVFDRRGSVGGKPSGYNIAKADISSWRKGEWHHIAGTWDSTTGDVNLYIDGELKATVKSYKKKEPFIIDGVGEYMSIGSGIYWSGEADAIIDELRISDIPRTSFCISKKRIIPQQGKSQKIDYKLYQKGNLIPNPGFEHNMAGWINVYGWRRPQQVEMGLDKEVAHGGKFSYKIHIPSHVPITPYACIKTEKILLKPDTTYTWSLYIKTKNLKEPAISLKIAELFDASGKCIGGVPALKLGNLPNQTKDWTLYRRVFTTPPEVAYGHFYLNNPAHGTLWFDDIKLTEGCILDAPKILSPKKGRINDNYPTFSWRLFKDWASEIGGWYTLEYSKDRSFPKEKTYIIDNLYTTFYKPERPLSNGKWFWRVFFQTPTNKSPYSEVAGFVVNVSPDNDKGKPIITKFSPIGVIDDVRPVISVSYEDNPKGSGINIGRVKIYLDGKDITEGAKVSPTDILYTPLSDLKKGLHTVYVRVMDFAGNLDEKEWSFSIKKAPQRIVIDKDNNLIVDGEPFFPIGIYNLSPHIFKEAREAGFNICFKPGEPDIDSLQFQKVLSAAYKYGIKIVANPCLENFKPIDHIYRGFFENIPHMEKKILTSLQNRISKVVYHPALLGWYTGDEIVDRGAHLSKVASVYRAIKEVDPYHPCILLPTYQRHRGELFARYTPVCDILMFDDYPIAYAPLNRISENIDRIRRSTSDTRPLWAILQAFSWEGYGGYKGRDARYPTFKEERCMSYLSIVHGVKGIIYWTYSGARGFSASDNKKFWHELKTVVKELKILSPVFLSPDSPIMVSSSPSLDTLVKNYQGTQYIIAVNPTQDSKEVKFIISDHNLKEVSVVFEKRKIPVKNGIFLDKFSGFDVHIYACTSSLPSEFLNPVTIQERTEFFPVNHFPYKKGEVRITGILCSSQSSIKWGVINVVDGKIEPDHGWSSSLADSDIHKLGKTKEWIALKLEKPTWIDKIILYPRFKKDGKIVHFPVDFVIQASNDGKKWITKKELKNYPPPQNHQGEIFIFKNLKTQYIRILATKLSEAEGHYYCQFSEVEVYGKQLP